MLPHLGGCSFFSLTVDFLVDVSLCFVIIVIYDAAFCQLISKHIGVDLAGLLGGRMASAEGGSVPSEVGYGEGCPLSSRLRGLGSVVSSPSGVRVELRPKTYFQGHRTLIFVPI